jgi:hypothetical protein
VPSSGKPFDGREEIQRAERLAHERVGATTLDAAHLLFVGTGEQHDGDLLRPLGGLQAHAELGAAHAGHPQVEHDHVGAPLLDAHLRLGSRLGLVHLDVGAFERHPKQLSECRLVVDEQNPHRTFSPVHVAPVIGTNPQSADTPFVTPTEKTSFPGLNVPAQATL